MKIISLDQNYYEQNLKFLILVREEKNEFLEEMRMKNTSNGCLPVNEITKMLREVDRIGKVYQNKSSFINFLILVCKNKTILTNLYFACYIMINSLILFSG